MIPFAEFKVGQQIKIFDSFQLSHWTQDDIEEWDYEDEEIWGVLGKTLAISELCNPSPRHLAFRTKEGYEVFREDVEYIVGGYGDLIGEVEPVSEPVSALLFG